MDELLEQNCGRIYDVDKFISVLPVFLTISVCFDRSRPASHCNLKLFVGKLAEIRKSLTWANFIGSTRKNCKIHLGIIELPLYRYCSRGPCCLRVNCEKDS